jgi:vacuolar-type H+-ATPase subunit I/STV1
MRFAKIVFWAAAIWGFLVLTPLYFMFDMIGQKDPPPITHPAFFYGFVGAGLAWQIAFVIIARDPVRFRPLMIPSVVEKFSYAIAGAVLVSQGRMSRQDLLFVVADAVWGVLFIAAWVLTGKLKERNA